ncbi:MAG: CBS domain-containing protein [Candidatus Kuenenia sp.]|nr:CBS domain-containing protein [Candidatus Kuenenia hertensis]
MSKNVILAKDIMKKTITAARKETLGRSLAEKLLTGNYSGMPVVNSNNQVIGIITEFDLIKAMDEGKALEQVTAEDIMTKKPICAEEDTPIEKIIHVMTKENIIRIPIVKDMVPVGVISRSDILRCVYGVLKPEFVRISTEHGEMEVVTEFRQPQYKSEESISSE